MNRRVLVLGLGGVLFVMAITARIYYARPKILSAPATEVPTPTKPQLADHGPLNWEKEFEGADWHEVLFDNAYDPPERDCGAPPGVSCYATMPGEPRVPSPGEEKLREFMYRLVDKAAPGYTMNVRYRSPDLFIGDLNGDKVNEVAISVIPRPATIPVKDERTWNDLLAKSKLIIVTPTDLDGRSIPVAEISGSKLMVLGGFTCGWRVLGTFDFNHDGKKEFLLNGCAADASVFAMLQISWPNHAINQMESCAESGQPSGYPMYMGDGGRAGDSHLKDLDGDGIDELINDTRYFNDNPWFNSKGELMVSKWNGKCFKESKELAQQLSASLKPGEEITGDSPVTRYP